MRDNLKKSDNELLKTTEDLVQRNKELEQFAYMVSHNLRAPVANILGFSYVLNSVGKNNEAVQQHILEGLTLSAKKLDDIVIELNDILQVRRTVEGKEMELFVAKASVVMLEGQNTNL